MTTTVRTSHAVRDGGLLVGGAWGKRWSMDTNTVLQKNAVPSKANGVLGDAEHRSSIG
ncbi:hypothetical protein ABZ341_03495 [Streptomyces sp. NPDC006173]|uniref:hypothetical protein n=1 Tax=Streptomyces sp. NPDC006173 TaxID=3155349 RepID=UPI0033EAC301